jgi:mannitol/fructose-specific phosphotransferase system IIA component (Ntr-type)
VAVTIAAMLAFVSTANAGIMAASRYPLALSRDGLLPEFVSKVSKKFKTPVTSIILTGGFITFSLVLPLETLAKTASAVILMTYILTNLSVIILRESNVVNYKPTFNAPFYPWVQIFIVMTFSYFISKLGYGAIETSLALIFLSIVIYFNYGKKNASQEYAFLHLLLRITENLKLEHDLESELRDIIHERDSVELDEFDKLVKNAVILDLNGPLTLDELFEIEAERLENTLKIQKDELIHLFNERERESSTAITEFTAIPHIVLEKEDLFNLVVIRCKQGIRFNDKKDSIKAVFLFISSSGVRKTHLRTLASIAALTREEDFEEKWMGAKNENYLRDIILLSKRKRFVK